MYINVSWLGWKVSGLYTREYNATKKFHKLSIKDEGTVLNYADLNIIIYNKSARNGNLFSLASFLRRF